MLSLMATEPTFISLLKADAARYREMAGHWEELEEEGVLRFEDLNGNSTSPSQMAAMYRERAEELQELVAKLQPKK